MMASGAMIGSDGGAAAAAADELMAATRDDAPATRDATAIVRRIVLLKIIKKGVAKCRRDPVG